MQTSPFAWSTPSLTVAHPGHPDRNISGSVYTAPSYRNISNAVMLSNGVPNIIGVAVQGNPESTIYLDKQAFADLLQYAVDVGMLRLGGSVEVGQ